MRTILSFQLPAKPGISEKDVIHSMWKWVTGSPHYDLTSPPPQEFWEKGFYHSVDYAGKTADFRLVQYIEGLHHYIAAQLEKPDESNNLLWQAQCIYERRDEDGETGAFHILLNRGVLHAGKTAQMQLIPSIPFIAKRLFFDELAVKPEDMASSEKERYPEIRIGQSIPLKDDLNNIFWPLASLSAQEGSEENTAKVIYQPAGIDYIYSFERDAEGTKARIVSDVFNMISEVHSGPELSFDALRYLVSDGEANAEPPVTHSNSYCYMNQAMASRLKQARRERGLSQKELAQRVDSSGLIISRLETIRVQRVLRSMLNDIERELGLPKDTIVSLQGERTPPSTAETKTNDVCLVPTSSFVEGNLPRKAGYCRYCGKHLYADSRFCPVCGTKILA